MSSPHRNPEIERLLLKKLYELHLARERSLDFRGFADAEGLSQEAVRRSVDELETAGLSRAAALGPHIRITPDGILHAEREGVVDPAVVRSENEIRYRILDFLQQERDEHGTRHHVHYTEIVSATGLSEAEFLRNISVLEGCWLVERGAVGTPTISPAGTEQIRTWRNQKRWLERFTQLETLDGITPQKRGHELEDLLAEIATAEGWEAKTQVRSQGQEHDVILHSGFHYFLVSCKWEKERVQPEVLELLESRVRSRATTNGGLLVSMSGFTDNCVDEARLKIASALILLFGPADVQALFTQKVSLTDLVDTKLQQAMHHRKVLVDGEVR